MIELRKSVPMPTSTKSYVDFPLETAEIGDSFVVPKSYGERQRVAGIITGWRLATRSPKRFRTMPVEGGTGVWRIE